MNTDHAVTETDRVRANTSGAVNHKIDQKAEQRVAYFALRPSEIPARLESLEREWDIERWLEAHGSTVALSGLVMGLVTNHRKWLVIPGVILPFLLMHAVQGWCPPVPVLRRLGVRTQREIEAERYALKMIRGDFEKLRMQLEEIRNAIESFRESLV